MIKTISRAVCTQWKEIESLTQANLFAARILLQDFPGFNLH
jgi:Zn-dependent peptidase ImmA (M78 family)